MVPFIDPDYSEAYQPITAGTYHCRILSCEFKTSQHNTKYINWKLETVPHGQTVFYSTPIQGRGAGMFKHFVKCAADPTYEDGRYNTDNLIGKIVVMSLGVKQVSSKGKTINVFEVKEIERISSEFLEEEIPF